MFKTITIKNVHIITHWNLLYALKIWSCLNFIQKRRLFFAKSSWYLLRSDRCLTNVNVSLEVQQMLMLALRLFLKGKGGDKQHCLIQFVGSNLGVETFLKKMEHQKMMRNNRGLRHLSILCIEVSRKFYVKPVCLFIVFWL